MKLFSSKLLALKRITWSRFSQLYTRRSAANYTVEQVPELVTNEDICLPELDEFYEEKARKRLDNLNDDLKRRRQRIETEIQEYRLRGYEVPETITALDLLQLVTYPSTILGRVLRLQALALKEKNQSKLNKKPRYCPDCAPVAVRGIEETDTGLDMINKYDYACHRALNHGMPLIFDMSYDISTLEQRKTCIRLINCYMQNMKHFNSYHMVFSGYENSYFGDAVKMYELDNRLHASFYKNVFSKPYNSDDYIYLSPRGEWLNEYEPDKTYIIGAYVDIYGRGDLTIARAKQLGIKQRQFPLMFYGRSKQDLGLNTVMDIMLEASMLNSWDKALYKSLVCKDRDSNLIKFDGSRDRQKWLIGYEKLCSRQMMK